MTSEVFINELRSPGFSCGNSAKQLRYDPANYSHSSCSESHQAHAVERAAVSAHVLYLTWNGFHSEQYHETRGKQMTKRSHMPSLCYCFLGFQLRDANFDDDDDDKQHKTEGANNKGPLL